MREYRPENPGNQGGRGWWTTSSMFSSGQYRLESFKTQGTYGSRCPLPAGGPILASSAARLTSETTTAPIPYRRSSTRGSSFASYAPAPTRLTASDELGLDCEPIPCRCHTWQPANRKRSTVMVRPGRQSPVPFGHRSSSADGAPEPPAMLAPRNHASRN